MKSKLTTIIYLLSLQQEEGSYFLSERKFVIKKEGFTITISSDREENITAEINFINQAIPEDMVEDLSLRLCEKNSTIAMSGFSITDMNQINKYYWYPASQDVASVGYSITMFLEDIAEFSKIKED